MNTDQLIFYIGMSIFGAAMLFCLFMIFYTSILANRRRQKRRESENRLIAELEREAAMPGERGRVGEEKLAAYNSCRFLSAEYDYD